MDNTEHAKLSASGAYRWIACTPSADFETRFKNESSQYAIEGTRAHYFCEKKLLHSLYPIQHEKPVCEDKDMDKYTDVYIDYCLEVLNSCKTICDDPKITVEERLDFSKWVPEGFGTGDCCIVADKTLHVIDFKYGQGLPVSAINNPQLRLYGLGALAAYEYLYDFDTICLHVVQPRLDNISVETISVDELETWANEIIVPAAKLAIDGKGEFKVGDHCGFCNAKKVCKARAEHYLQLTKFNQQDPRELTKTEVASIIEIAEGIKKWSDDVKDYALHEVLEGEDIPGYKAVRGRSTRIITQPIKVAETLVEGGFDEALIYKPKELMTLTNLEKLVGKKAFTEMCAQYIDKPEGKPTLVHISDKREAITNSAVLDFAQEIKEVCSIQAT